MKTRWIPSSLFALSLLALVANTGWSEDGADAKKATHPLGDHHALLGQMEGEWTVAGERFMPGVAQGMPMTGTSEFSWVLNNHFLKQTFEMPMGEMGTFVGMGYFGYDTAKKKWQNIWLDTMGTGMTITEPTWTASDKCWTSEFDMRSQGGEVKARQVVRLKDANTLEMLFYATPKGQPGAKEFLQMSMTYSRVKSDDVGGAKDEGDGDR